VRSFSLGLDAKKPLAEEWEEEREPREAF